MKRTMIIIALCLLSSTLAISQNANRQRIHVTTVGGDSWMWPINDTTKVWLRIEKTQTDTIARYYYYTRDPKLKGLYNFDGTLKTYQHFKLKKFLRCRDKAGFKP